jgi:hypothetical protein
VSRSARPTSPARVRRQAVGVPRDRSKLEHGTAPGGEIEGGPDGSDAEVLADDGAEALAVEARRVGRQDDQRGTRAQQRSDVREQGNEVVVRRQAAVPWPQVGGSRMTPS